jgi:pimeloyl-ACP methyl ester carboxylesterase
MVAPSSTANLSSSLAQPGMQILSEAGSYAIDAVERWLLFLDVMQRRSEQYKEHLSKTAPHVLKFDCELVADGRQLRRPVNYGLVRVKPPAGVELDMRKRPFIVVDPRAGHGPGIGGFKADSEIGAAFQAGHPCYFIGFLPEPLPGQTIEDVIYAKAAFVETVGTLHADAEGKPAVVGNCQAGWAVMMAAAIRPGLFGPLIIAGTPLSYWAGKPGENPLRYTGGLLGGSWLTALMSDLGHGRFDGAWLVSNFENLNPANTLWTKHYNLYANIDRESARYLDFEQWWGGHTLLNAEEMQFIVDDLFIGNKLAAADVVFSDGMRVDLRQIRSPIVVFCSKADDITPPAQALDWILDLYENVDEIKAHGQTIVYAVHETAGHLGIFVSASVAKKEHSEFASNIDLIDVLPPGLYEAVITPKDPAESRPDLVSGDYLAKFEARTFDHLRAQGCNNEEDNRQFAAVERLSDMNLGLYRTLVQPWMQLMTNEAWADWTRRVQPLRLQYELFSSANPFMPDLSRYAESARQTRHPVSQESAFWKAQEWVAQTIEATLQAYGNARDHYLELIFQSVYGSPTVQALAGMRASDASPRRKPGRDATHSAFVAARRNELQSRIAEGGPREATIRALLYIRMPEGIADERSFRLIQQMREDAGTGLTLSDFKKVVREQFFMLLIDERAAISAIPAMLATDADLALRMAASLRRLIKMVNSQSVIGRARLDEIEALFDASRRNRAGTFTGRELEYPPVSQPAPSWRSGAAAVKDQQS